MFFTTDSSVLSTHAHNETNVAYRCAKTLVFTSSDMKSTDKRIVCQGEYQRILANFGRIFVFPDSPTTIVSKDKVTIIYQEQQYIDLLKEIIDCGEVRPDRTGTGVKTVFGRSMVFDLRNSIPILTTKRVFVRGVIEELLWFVSGSSDATVLGRKNVKIWEHNTSRQFLDDIGLNDLEEGDTGPLYGHTLRHCGAKYIGKNTDYTGQGVDQLRNVIETIKSDPYGRRHVISLWNPETIGKSVLPPCHGGMIQFFVSMSGELSCVMYQRSVDAFLGLPFNIMSYAVLTYMIAQVCGLRPGDMKIDMGDTHIYSTHADAVDIQIRRMPMKLPTLLLNPRVDDITAFKIEDFEVENYEHHPAIKASIC
jgi:thymidylate synthase